MFTRWALLLILALGQVPATANDGITGDSAGSPEPAHSHCAEHTADSGTHHCDHVTQCQCDHACGSGIVLDRTSALSVIPGLVPAPETVSRTLPANSRLPFRPPSL